MGINFPKNPNDIGKYVLFINDTFLVVGEGRNIKYAKTELFFKKVVVQEDDNKRKKRGKSKDKEIEVQVKYFKQQDPYEASRDVGKIGDMLK